MNQNTTQTQPKIRAVGYVRVSTDEQKPESQKLYLQKYAQEHDIEIVAIYEDVAVSGYEVPALRRPGFRRAVEHAIREKCAILTISLDRISRRLEDLVKTLEHLQQHGIEVIPIQEEWLRMLMSIQDETLRKLLFNVVVTSLGYAYEMYIKTLKEKIKAGLERARQEGKQIGRPSPMRDPLKQMLFKTLYCSQHQPIRLVAKVLGIHPNSVPYWAKKLC